MKHLCKHWLPVLLGCLIFASCTEDELVNRVEEGMPASLKLILTVPQANDANVTRATPDIESNINELALFFYKNGGSKPIVKKFGSLEPTKKDGCNYIYEIEVPVSDDLTSGNYLLYAIANWDNLFFQIPYDTYIDKASGSVGLENLTLDQLKEVVITRRTGNNNLDLMVRAPMSGKFGSWDGDGFITLQPGANDFTGQGSNNSIHLRRLLARVGVRITYPEDVEFTAESYSIYKFSCSSTLLERMGWNDDIKGTIPVNLEYKGSGTFDKFEDMKFVDGTKDTLTFYMPENVQKMTGDKLKTFSDLEYAAQIAMREKRTDPNGTAIDRPFEYAPENSTYLVIKGHYKGPVSTTSGKEEDKKTVTGDVTYTIQLGDFKAGRGGGDNFTLRRNTAYSYTVKITGVNSIVTEAGVETFGEETRPGAEGNLIQESSKSLIIPLDAHYEKVLLRIHKDMLKKPIFFVNTPFSATPKGGVDVNNVSEIPEHSKDCNWIKFAKPIKENGKYDFGKYNKGEGLANVFDLVKEFYNINANSNITETDHCYVDGDSIYTTAYVDEYFYAEDPNDGSPSVPLEKFVNQPDRVMSICTSKLISVDGKSTYMVENIVSFTQCAIHTIYPLTTSTNDGTYNPFGIEKTNEWNADGNGLNRGTTDDSGLVLDNGWANTQKLISGATYPSYAGYRFNTPTDIYPEFHIDSEKPAAYIAAMSRNRDVDDNGTIDDDELKWYIPARNQCVTLWMGNRDLGVYRPYDADNLANKTGGEVEGPDGLIHTSSSGNSKAWWAIEGASFGPNTDDNKLDMRCIRNLGTGSGQYKEVPSQLSYCLNNIITVTGLADNSIRKVTMRGEYAPFHKERELNNRIPAKFEVAKTDLEVSLPILNIEGQTSSIQRNGGVLSRTYAYTVNLTITDIPDGTSIVASDGWTISSQSGSTYTFTQIFSDDNSVRKFKVYAVANNIAYSAKTPITCSNYTGWTNSTIDFSPDATGTPTESVRSTFTADEIKALKDLAAANYSQVSDGKDKGQWRVPNQRELALIMSYVSNGSIDASGFDDNANYASSTFYTATKAGKNNPFHIDEIKSNPFITLSEMNNEFKIRPVRDVE